MALHSHWEDPLSRFSRAKKKKRESQKSWTFVSASIIACIRKLLPNSGGEKGIQSRAEKGGGEGEKEHGHSSAK